MKQIVADLPERGGQFVKIADLKRRAPLE